MIPYTLMLLLLGFLAGAAAGLLTGCWLVQRAPQRSMEAVDYVHVLLFGVAATAFALLGVLVVR
jgi:ABC-type phosphate transport system permease subunit